MEAKQLEIPITGLLQDYFTGANSIDVFNHHSQGGLRLEETSTKDCWFRVFQCMLGTVETSSFNAFRYFEGKTDFKHSEFTETLAKALTGYEEKEKTTAASSSSGKRKRTSRSEDNVKHTILLSA
jgi:hypothetical protein